MGGIRIWSRYVIQSWGLVNRTGIGELTKDDL